VQRSRPGLRVIELLMLIATDYNRPILCP